MPIDRHDVEHIARLARLELDPATLARFREQLETILDHVAMLDELDLEGVEPMARPPATRGTLREDEPQPCLGQETALAPAPDADDGHFRVPRVLEEP